MIESFEIMQSDEKAKTIFDHIILLPSYFWTKYMLSVYFAYENKKQGEKSGAVRESKAM